MSAQYAIHHDLQLDENESALLARAILVLTQELGFDPDEVRRSYSESIVYFMSTDHIDPSFRRRPPLTGQ